MSNINVSTTAGLLTALKTAKAGDTISLAAGNYASVDIRNINIAGNVTIQSANGSKPAVLTDLTVRDSKGLTFSNLELSAGAKEDYPFKVLNSSAVTLDRLNVHGTLDDNPQNDRALVMIRESRNVTVSNSEFQQAFNAVSHINNDGLKIVGNDFHDIRTDGIRGGGASNLLISGNYFTDFYPIAGDHPDAIQLWTDNTSVAAKNITITNNVVVRGEGSPMQGIFLRDSGRELPFENVTITGNTMIGSMYNGISVESGKNLSIQNNKVVGMADQKSWIRLTAVTDATVANNAATDYIYTESSNVSRFANVSVGVADVATAGRMASWVDAYKGSMTTLGASLLKAFDGKIAAFGVIDGTAAQKAATAALFNFEERLISGTSGNDRLVASGIGDFRLDGGDGNDTLSGGVAGTTRMYGGDGDDNYTVRTIDDIVIELADGGKDTVASYIDYRLTDNVETLRMMQGDLVGYGNALDNRLTGSSGDDTLYGEGGDDSIVGGAGDDRLWGGAGADTLRGDEGNDSLYGDDGDDMLIGGAGNDLLDGGAGSDTLQGGLGADKLKGGLGADTFLYRPGDFDEGVKVMDEILDFSSAQKDKIGLSLLDANVKTAVDDRFAFIGTKAFGKVAGELRYEKQGGNSVVMGDVNGDGVADFAIKLIGVGSLSAADFVL